MPDPSVAHQAEADAARLALEKRARNEKLSRAEISAIARVERRREAERLREAYARCALKDLCAVLGAERKQVARWVSYGLPRAADGTFDLTVAVPWLRAYEERLRESRREPVLDAQEQVRRIKAQRMELELAEKREQVAPRKHFQDWIWTYFRGLSRRLQSFPRTVAATREEELRLSGEMTRLLSSFGAELAGQVGQPPAPAKAQKARRSK